MLASRSGRLLAKEQASILASNHCICAIARRIEPEILYGTTSA